jgi:hypothetical protein
MSVAVPIFGERYQLGSENNTFIIPQKGTNTENDKKISVAVPVCGE